MAICNIYLHIILFPNSLLNYTYNCKIPIAFKPRQFLQASKGKGFIFILFFFFFFFYYYSFTSLVSLSSWPVLSCLYKVLSNYAVQLGWSILPRTTTTITPIPSSIVTFHIFQWMYLFSFFVQNPINCKNTTK